MVADYEPAGSKVTSLDNGQPLSVSLGVTMVVREIRDSSDKYGSDGCSRGSDIDKNTWLHIDALIM